MGVLGYTPKEALESNINDLLLALKGRIELMSMIFGSSSSKPKKSRPMAPDDFRAMFRSHNARFKKDKG